MRRLIFALPVLALLCAAVVPTAASAKVRTYYIAADEVEWNYLPLGKDMIKGQVLPTPPPDTPGNTFIKALYREYTDATFAHLKPRKAEEQYLGYLGPIVRAEVGDSIRIVFRNNATRPYSIHAHGVRYDKGSEGAPYLTPGGVMEGGVPPHGTRVYTYAVPDRAGPGPADPSSVAWMYHSHVDEEHDVASGLMGTIIVTRKGMARADGSPKDVEREFVTMYGINSESDSWYIMDNVKKFAREPDKADPKRRGWINDNLRFDINGYAFGNMPMPTMRVGDRVRWYAMGDADNDFENHTPHWHGQSLLSMGMRTDTLSIQPASMQTADMIPDNPGVWLFHCHFPGHQSSGMVELFKVLPARSTAAKHAPKKPAPMAMAAMHR